MNGLDKDSAEHAAEYIGVVKGSWPLICLAGAIALTSALHQIKRGYKQRTRAQQTATVLTNAILTTAIAVSGALLLPFFYPDVTPEVQIAVSFGLAGIGGETVKQVILGKLGLSVVDLMNPNDINEVRKMMPPDTRKRHVEQCPFREEECAPDGQSKRSAKRHFSG